MVRVPLTRREMEYLLAGRGQRLWPDEERLCRRLRQALTDGTPPCLTRLQVQMVQDWIDDASAAGFGARIRTPEERAISAKLETALATPPGDD